jgi:hypothetical protein
VDTIDALRAQARDDARLRKDWCAHAHAKPFYPYPYICDDGLFLGAGTRIAAMGEDRDGRPCLETEGEEERILALLSLAYGKPIAPSAVKYVERASLQWGRGEKAIAHFELAFARLPRFDARDDGFPLFCADRLFKQGVPPRWLMRYRGIDAGQLDLLKRYNPAEPRVPAGSGIESGRWTDAAVAPGATVSLLTDSPASSDSKHRIVVAGDSKHLPHIPGENNSSDKDHQERAELGIAAPGEDPLHHIDPLATSGLPVGVPLPRPTPAPATPAPGPNPSSNALRRALEKAGEIRPPDSDTHHMVAGKKKEADSARSILERFGIGINDAENGVFLPSKQHDPLHTRQYYDAINRALEPAQSREDAIRILGAIKRRLKSRKFP